MLRSVIHLDFVREHEPLHCLFLAMKGLFKHANVALKVVGAVRLLSNFNNNNHRGKKGKRSLFSTLV